MKKAIFRIIILFVLINVFSVISAEPIRLQLAQGRANVIQQYGITWQFSEKVEFGQYINGDYWVVDPGTGIELIQVTPASTLSASRIINGSMLNPKPEQGQGFDNSISVLTYRSELNVARPNGNDLTASNPTILQAGDSLVSTISYSSPDVRPQVADAAVLTIVDSSPERGTFRPPYTGQAQTPARNISEIDRSVLLNLSLVGTAPDINDVAEYFKKPWIDFLGGWNGRHIHPDNNMPEFAREIAIQTSVGALMLCLNFPEAQKETLLIRYIQLGLDNWGIVQAGGTRNWMPDGAHAGGRKWPIMFAGILLDDAPMMNIGPGDGKGTAFFGEDAQTFYVTQFEVDLTNSAAWTPDYRSVNAQPYSSEHIGMPEWGIRHATEPNRSDAAWDTVYRNTAAIGWPGYVLAARLMGSMNLWDHPALFDYMDRFMTIRRGNNYLSYPAVNQQPVASVVDTSSLYTFIEEMWDVYR